MKPYDALIKFGRMLRNHSRASDFAKKHPEVVLGLVDDIEALLCWTEVDQFFRLFPPIKRYVDDGTWDYASTKKMIRETFGTHFGKDAVKELLMSRCYENRFVHLVGFSYMCAVSEVSRRQTGLGVMERLLLEGR